MKTPASGGHWGWRLKKYGLEQNGWQTAIIRLHPDLLPWGEWRNIALDPNY
jgi:hypothetical protein